MMTTTAASMEGGSIAAVDDDDRGQEAAVVEVVSLLDDDSQQQQQSEGITNMSVCIDDDDDDDDVGDALIVEKNAQPSEQPCSSSTETTGVVDIPMGKIQPPPVPECEQCKKPCGRKRELIPCCYTHYHVSCFTQLMREAIDATRTGNNMRFPVLKCPFCRRSLPYSLQRKYLDIRDLAAYGLESVTLVNQNVRRSLVKGSCMATVLKSLQAINSLDAKLEASTKKASAKNAAAATKSKAKEWSQLLSWKSGTNRKTAWSTGTGYGGANSSQHTVRKQMNSAQSKENSFMTKLAAELSILDKTLVVHSPCRGMGDTLTPLSEEERVAKDKRIAALDPTSLLLSQNSFSHYFLSAGSQTAVSRKRRDGSTDTTAMAQLRDITSDGWTSVVLQTAFATSALPAIIETLLRQESMDVIANSHAATYKALFKLLKHFASDHVFLSTLVNPNDCFLNALNRISPLKQQDLNIVPLVESMAKKAKLVQKQMKRSKHAGTEAGGSFDRSGVLALLGDLSRQLASAVRDLPLMYSYTEQQARRHSASLAPTSAAALHNGATIPNANQSRHACDNSSSSSSSSSSSRCAQLQRSCLTGNVDGTDDGAAMVIDESEDTNDGNEVIGGKRTQAESTANDAGNSDHECKRAKEGAFLRKYEKEMKNQVFRTVSLDSTRHAFSALIAETERHKPASTRMKRIFREIASLSTGVPIHPASAIFVRVDEDRPDVMRAAITGPDDTPYANGFFIFDIFLPMEYPSKPPSVKLTTTGRGSVRFGPNLYRCGKVCLSLLGTWQGPKWDPQVSTILQVLLSIQSLILCEQPYYNEPGFEFRPNDQTSQQYNISLKYHTLSKAILGHLQSPDPSFNSAIRAHLTLKRDTLFQQMEVMIVEFFALCYVSCSPPSTRKSSRKSTRRSEVDRTQTPAAKETSKETSREPLSLLVLDGLLALHLRKVAPDLFTRASGVKESISTVHAQDCPSPKATSCKDGGVAGKLHLRNDLAKLGPRERLRYLFDEVGCILAHCNMVRFPPVHEVSLPTLSALEKTVMDSAAVLAAFRTEEASITLE